MVGRGRFKQDLCHALREFFAERMRGHMEMDVKIVDDLIILRCKEALSLSEVNLSTLRAGRLLLQEVNERLCQELKPDVGRLLREITGRRLVDICVGLFAARREKVYLFTMSDKVKQ